MFAIQLFGDCLMAATTAWIMTNWQLQNFISDRIYQVIFIKYISRKFLKSIALIKYKIG